MQKNQLDTVKTDTLPQLLELMTAYQRSRILFTLVDLKIPTILNKNKYSAAELARQKKINPLAMERFLNACVSIGLLKKENNTYFNSDLTESFLVKNKEFYLGGEVTRHKNRSYKIWSKLTNSLKKWKYGNDKSTEPQDEDQGAEAMKEQHNLALLQGFALAEAYDFSKHKRVLDLGGGTGATSLALCKSFPNLKSTIFELPKNAEIALDYVEKNNLTNKIEIISGDFKNDELPANFDAVILANFMSVADVNENKKLLKTIYKKLPENGVCILSGWIIDNSQLSPQISILFCLEDICWNAPDVERSEAVYTEWMKEAGFKKINCQTYFEPSKILYGIK